MGLSLRKYMAIAALALGLGAPERAVAVEAATPVLPGAVIGIPAGAAPPPGLYFSSLNLTYNSSLVNNAGRSFGTDVDVLETSPSLLLSTDLKLFGGTYFAYIVQPFERVSAYSAGGTLRATGPFNTIIAPLNLSWPITDSLFVSSGIGFYLPNGDYSRDRLSVANGYVTYQPTVALSYLNDGINLTANLMFNINEINNSTGYKSGNLLNLEYTATKSWDAFTAGVGGYFVSQFEDDKIRGQVVPATAFNGRGNRYEKFAIGPYFSYDFKTFAVAAWATRDLYASNAPQATTGWLRVSIPLGNPFGPDRTVPPIALPAAKRP